MSFRLLATLACGALLGEAGRCADAPATVTIRADAPGASVSSNLFGIFFEEINFGGDGGLYAEMVRNRTFANSANPDFWTLVAGGNSVGDLAVDTTLPLNGANLSSLRLKKISGTGSVGAANPGYWGMVLQAGATYDLSFYARASNDFSGLITARLESSDGTQVYAQTTLGGLTTGWRKIVAALVPSGSSGNARLVLSVANNGTVWLDDVSLFPRSTFKGRTNGLRTDLAAKLVELSPSFLRFPGGCYVEGNVLNNAFRWKNSIGDIAQRPGHWNGVWNYFSTDGLGFHEYLQLCEDLGAEPLFGINCGMSHTEVVPLAEMGPYVQDALDAIEYANGATNTTWGALRAANGHPAPFQLRYLEIGNENGGADYDARYALFYDAIKAAHPEIQLIACVWGGTPWSRPFDLMDEHYYTDPATMASYATKYDTYGRSGAKVFVGEFAVTSGFGTYGNLAAALGEAAFMTGMERNSDIVEMACYAPLFANVNGMQWRPNMINFDNSRSFGTPAYYVQQMFARNRGHVALPVSVVAPTSVANPLPQGALGVGSWATSVQYSNVVVISNGVTLYASDFVNQGTGGWQTYNGTWSANNGVYQQTSTTTADCRSTTGSTNWAEYTLSLRARKTGGSEGFLILFNWLDDNNWTWLNLGGWGNTQHGIERMSNGSKTSLGTRVAGSIQNNQWYDISIVLSGRRIQCYLNNTLIQDVSYPATSPAGLYASSTYDQAHRQIICKVVNPYAQTLTTTFNTVGTAIVEPNAALIRLTSGNPADENTFETPTKVLPITNLVSNAGTNFALTLPPHSLSILRLQLGTPLPPHGFKASGSGWQVGLSWAPYETATNYILKHATSPGGLYTVLAVTNSTSFVDWRTDAGVTHYYTLSALLPSGSTPETAPVSASVGASLRAHLRFDEGTGLMATDTSGNGWNGSLWGGASWTTGQVGGAIRLNGTSQYVSLPPGVVTNLVDFSLTAWVNISALADWARIFDFGSGPSSYLFLTPRSGSGVYRFAITTNGYGAEQQISGPKALPTDGWHHVAVTLSGEQGVLYLDGTPVGTNSAMTLKPAALNLTTQNWIGRSQFSGDPYLNGAVDDLRIYAGALAPGEVATLIEPLAPPTGLSAAAGDGRAVLTWNRTTHAGGYNVAAATNLGGPYTLKATRLEGLTFTDLNLQNGVIYYYVISATNTVGASPNSAPVGVRPVSLVPPALSSTQNGSQLRLTWPADHTGWRLQAQTNALAAGLGTNWIDVSGAASTNTTVVPIESLNPTVFYRLVYP